MSVLRLPPHEIDALKAQIMANNITKFIRTEGRMKILQGDITDLWHQVEPLCTLPNLKKCELKKITDYIFDVCKETQRAGKKSFVQCGGVLVTSVEAAKRRKALRLN